MQMLLTNSRVNAPDALRLGLVHRVVSRSSLAEESERLAAELASRDPAALAAAQEAVLAGAELTLAQGLELEERLASRLMARTQDRPAG